MTTETEPHWDSSVLLTIDVQGDFLTEGDHGIPGTTEILPALKRLADAFRLAGRPIVHVVRAYLPDGSNADISRRALVRGGASVVRPGTPGVELAPGLGLHDTRLDTDTLMRGELQTIGPDEHVLYKPRWNAFHRTVLEQWLHGRRIDTVVVAGCNFPNCPRATLFGASERDLRAVAIIDATSQWTLNAAAELRSIGVHPLSTEAAIANLAALGKMASPKA